MHPVATCENSGTPHSGASRSFDPPAVEGGLSIAAREETRRAVQQATASPRREPGAQRFVPLPDRVRVSGQVRRAGRPIADFDLTFRSVGSRSKDDDWDSTDEEGRYEVEVRADHYVVLNDALAASAARERWLTRVTVPAGERELVLDIDLPPEESAAVE